MEEPHLNPGGNHPYLRKDVEGNSQHVSSSCDAYTSITCPH